MGAWRRIGDDDVARYGRRSLAFASPKGAYRVEVDEEHQGHIRVHHAGREMRWTIEVKEVCGGRFRLSGMTFGAKALLSDNCWYELVLTSPGSITYWGDRVILRQDREE